MGLNPVLLELAVGGAHNDTLLLLALAAALRAHRRRQPALPRPARRALVARGSGSRSPPAWRCHSSARADAARASACDVAARAPGSSLALLAALGLIGFGSHALGFLSAVSEQQQLVATHSVPAETARLVGLHGTPSWWRHCFIAGFVVVLVYALWRTLRGADWRVAAGWATLALLLSTAWLLPWYAIWPLPLAAVSGDRRLRAATLVFCAYALLIHLPLANPLLSPPARHLPHAARLRSAPAGSGSARHRVHLTRLEVPGHVALDLRRRGIRAQPPQARSRPGAGT